MRVRIKNLGPHSVRLMICGDGRGPFRNKAVVRRVILTGNHIEDAETLRLAIVEGRSHVLGMAPNTYSQNEVESDGR